MVYLWDSENSMKPTCWCPNPCALGCQTLAVDRHHSKLTIGRACDDSVLTDSQCGEAQNVGPLWSIQIQESNASSKISQGENTVFKKNTALFPKQAWNISKDKTKLPVPLGFSRFCVCIHFNFKAITMASAIFTIASTDIGWPLMRSWWSTSRSVHVEGVSKKKHRNVPSKKRGNLMWDPNDSALCFRKIEAYICW